VSQRSDEETGRPSELTGEDPCCTCCACTMRNMFSFSVRSCYRDPQRLCPLSIVVPSQSNPYCTHSARTFCTTSHTPPPPTHHLPRQTEGSGKSKGTLAHMSAGLTDTARRLFARRNYDQLKVSGVAVTVLYMLSCVYLQPSSI